VKLHVSFVSTGILGPYVTLVKLAFLSPVSDSAGTATIRTMKKLKNATKNRELRFLVFKVSHQPIVAGDMKLID
jgi:hypothetical protein